MGIQIITCIFAEKFKYMNTGLKIYDKHVAFWGSAFSNFYPCKFVLDGEIWISSEQFFMACKARCFDDYDSYREIRIATTPEQAKKIGRKVKGFTDSIWDRVKYQLMFDGVYAKFSQNEDLKAFLLSPEFEGKDFVEGSPFDSVWGVKIDYRNPDIDNEENWQGQNLLGKVLGEVRDRLKNEKEV